MRRIEGVCIEPGCTDRRRGDGFCRKHYFRNYHANVRKPRKPVRRAPHSEGVVPVAVKGWGCRA